MKSIELILAIWLATSAWAQTLPPSQQVNPPATAHPSGARTQPLAAPQKTAAQPANIQAKPSPGSAKAGMAQPSSRFGRGSDGIPANPGRSLPAQSMATESGRRHGRSQGAGPRFPQPNGGG